MSERDRLITLAHQLNRVADCCEANVSEPDDAKWMREAAAALSQPHASEQGASVLDVGFKYEDGVHTPTVLVGFAVNDWKARDEFAASLAPHAPAPVQAEPAFDDSKAPFVKRVRTTPAPVAAEPEKVWLDPASSAEELLDAVIGADSENPAAADTLTAERASFEAWIASEWPTLATPEWFAGEDGQQQLMVWRAALKSDSCRPHDRASLRAQPPVLPRSVAGGTPPAATEQATQQAGRQAFERYLKDCDECAIVPDVAGAFQWAWSNQAAPVQAAPTEPDQTPADFASWLLGNYTGTVIDDLLMADAIAAYNAECATPAPVAAPAPVQGHSWEEEQARFFGVSVEDIPPSTAPVQAGDRPRLTDAERESIYNAWQDKRDEASYDDLMLAVEDAVLRAAPEPEGWQTDAHDIVKTIALALERGYAPSDILDENSPVRDRIRAAIAAPVPPPLTDAAKRQLIGNYFAVAWAKEAAWNMLDEYDRTPTRAAGGHGSAIEALRELLDTTYSEMPNFEHGKEAQDAWADRRAKARNNAASLIAASGEQAASPTVDQAMDEAVAAGDGTLHGAIDYWQERALKTEAAVGEQEKKPLSEEEIRNINENLWKDMSIDISGDDAWTFARAIEAAHGIAAPSSQAAQGDA